MGSPQLFLVRLVTLILSHQICYFLCPKVHFPLVLAIKKIKWFFMSGSQCHDNESSLQLLLQSLFIKELDVDDIYGMVTRIPQFSLSLPALLCY